MRVHNRELFRTNESRNEASPKALHIGTGSPAIWPSRSYPRRRQDGLLCAARLRLPSKPTIDGRHQYDGMKSADAKRLNELENKRHICLTGCWPRRSLKKPRWWIWQKETS